MKKLTILLMMSMISSLIFGQLSSQTKSIYQQKIESYKKLENTGIFIGMLGLYGLGTGSFLTIKGIEHMKSTDTNLIIKGHQQITEGLVFIGVGCTMTIPGIILTSIGIGKGIEYKQKLNIGILYKSNIKGFCLIYKF